MKIFSPPRTLKLYQVSVKLTYSTYSSNKRDKFRDFCIKHSDMRLVLLFAQQIMQYQTTRLDKKTFYIITILAKISCIRIDEN